MTGWTKTKRSSFTDETRLPLAPAAQQILDAHMATVDPDELQQAHEDRQARYMRALDEQSTTDADRRTAA